MKIIIIISLNPYFENSASANRWRTLIDGIAELDVKIELYITNGFSTFAEYKSLKTKKSIGSIEIKYLSPLFQNNIWLRRINIYILNRLIYPYVNFKLKQRILSENDNIIWTDCSYNSLKLAVDLKKTNPKVLCYSQLFGQ